MVLVVDVVVFVVDGVVHDVRGDGVRDDREGVGVHGGVDVGVHDGVGVDVHGVLDVRDGVVVHDGVDVHGDVLGVRDDVGVHDGGHVHDGHVDDIEVQILRKLNLNHYQYFCSNRMMEEGCK
jgi:hypothetical protein